MYFRCIKVPISFDLISLVIVIILRRYLAVPLTASVTIFESPSNL